MSENKETKQEINKLMVDDYDIIVTGRVEKPYYQIKYHEVGSEPDKYDIGFGSYILGNVFEWRNEYFEIVPEDEKKRETTNKQIMYHLKEIEIAQGCLANAFAALFSLIHARKKMLEIDKIDKMEESIICSGLNALLMCTNNMSEISGLNERTKEVVDKMEVHEIKDADDLLDFPKEILK